jgi:hypothetical protein
MLIELRSPPPGESGACGQIAQQTAPVTIAIMRWELNAPLVHAVQQRPSGRARRFHKGPLQLAIPPLADHSLSHRK